jgi:malate dehydrogenase (oxaloacetate-decarboxylating)(NADP+)
MAMEQEGLTTQQAVDNIYLIDSKGLVSKDRENEKDMHKMVYAKSLPNYQDLEKIVEIVKPSCLIGVCAQPKVFTPSVLRKMAQYNESPLIFPLSNPTSKAECTAEEAYINTDGIYCYFTLYMIKKLSS